MGDTKACDIRIYGDYTECATCLLAWDTNDVNPPKCKRDARKVNKSVADRLVAYVDRLDGYVEEDSAY